MEKLKSELTSITNRYIGIVSSKTSDKSGLEKFANSAKLTSEYLSPITDELIDKTNKYLEINDIESTDEAEELIKEQIQNFTSYCLTGSV